MRLEWLRCFSEVAKTNSITQAAKNLYLSQPAISKMIRSLEKETGEILLIRSAIGVQLTKQGELFEQFANDVLKSHEKYLLKKSKYENQTYNYQGTIEVAISPLLLQSYYQILIQKMKQKFPYINLCFVESDLDSAQSMLMTKPDTLGLVLTYPDVQVAPEVILDTIYSSSIVICTSKNSHYASLKTVSPDDIPADKMISIEFAKQLTSNRPATYNLHTTNLELVAQKLLNEDDVCVSVPQLIANKKLLSPHIIQIYESIQHVAFVSFIHSQKATYGEEFLLSFKNELQKCLLT